MNPTARLAFLVACVFAVGCGSGTPNGTGQSGDDPNGVPARDAADAPPGRWLLYRIAVRQLAEEPVAIVEVQDGKVTVLEPTEGDEEAWGKPLLAELKDGVFHLRFEDEQGSIVDFRATPDRGEYRGNAIVEGTTVVWPVRLAPTELTSLDTMQTTPLAGKQALEDVFRSPGTEALEKFVKERRSSPVSLLASELIIIKSQQGTDDEIRQRVADYEKLAAIWGERYGVYASLHAPFLLSRVGVEPPLVRSLLESAKADLDDSARERWKGMLDEITDVLALSEAKLALAGDDAEARDAARKALEERNQGDPTDAEVTYLLAEDAEKRGEMERALALFGEIVALPGLEFDFWQTNKDRELPSDRFGRIWTELRGKDAPEADREKFLGELYEKRAFAFAGDSSERVEPTGNKTSLVELFTGTSCPPCVAADLALGAVEKDYGHETLVAIRYHQHIPGPDPFANSATETRFDYYAPPPPDRAGTPTTVLNGEKVFVAGGFDRAALSHATLLDALEPALAEKTDVAIALETEAKADKLRIKASVTGVPADAKSVRLRVVLAESLVHHPARNGVRLHEMVVRAMPAGVEGVAVSGDSGEFETTLDLPALKKSLLADLAAFEEARNETLPKKPMPFEGFHVVAFVQDDATKEVLQAEAVEVEGNLVFDEDGPALGAGAGEKVSRGDNTPAKDPDAAPAREEGPPGRWLVWLIDVGRRAQFPVGIVAIEDGKAELVDSLVGDADSITLADGKFRLRSTDEDEDTFDFVATGTNAELRGSAVIEGAGNVWLVRLEPTEIESLEEVSPSRVDGFDEFQEAASSPDAAGFQKFIDERRSNPLSLVASEALILFSQREQLDDDAIRKRAESYETLAATWGDRYAAYARLRAPLMLARVGHAPGLARELAKAATDKLDDGLRDQWKSMLEEIDEKLVIAEAKLALAGDDAAAKEAARKTLNDLVANDPTRPDVTYILAEDAEKNGDKEAALRLYGEIVALPGLELDFWRAASSVDEDVELPSDRFERLWTELRGEDAPEADRQKFLAELYEKRAFAFAGDSSDRVEPTGNKTSLVELFTGTTCPPCVAADLALGGIEKAYGHETLVAIRYHQHIPGPDPFANSATEARFDFYSSPTEPTGTPTTIVNGAKVSVGGGLDLASMSYRTLLDALKPALAEKTDVAIALETEAKSDKLRIKASVTGLPADSTGVRLRVVLAETLVRHPARNGVRLHEMVVRAMPAGVKGVAVSGDSGEFETTLDLPELKKSLLDDLGHLRGNTERVPPKKPMPFEGFHVVAFVQDDATREVLQAKAVEVEGKLVFDVEKAPAEKETEPEAKVPAGVE